MSHKYHAIPTTVDGIRFQSKAEARRYAELKLLEKAGEIYGLELQPRFPITVSARGYDKPVTICTYVADFRYRFGRMGILTIEDVKGMKTPVYRLKKKMVEAQYGIQIQEIR